MVGSLRSCNLRVIASALSRSALVFLACAGLSLATETTELIRRLEGALAVALNTQNEVVLSALTDKNVTIYWTVYSFERITTTTEGRNAWLHDVRRMRGNAYHQSIARIQTPNADQATVTIEERWTMWLPGGIPTEKRFRTTDFWFRSQGAWRLTGRDSRPYRSNS